MDIGKKKVSFPMVANYDSVVRYFVECGLDAQFIMPPKMTSGRLEIVRDTARIMSVHLLKAH